MYGFLAQTTQGTDPVLTAIVWGGLVACAVWVGVDAKRIGARRGLLPGFFNLGPVGWAVGTFLLWIVAFPAYMYKRSDILAAARAEQDGFGGSAAPFQTPPFQTPPFQTPSSQTPPLSGPPGQPPLSSPNMPPPPPREVPPAGWMEDPDGGDALRWWDGVGWTEHRAPRE